MKNVGWGNIFHNFVLRHLCLGLVLWMCMIPNIHKSTPILCVFICILGIIQQDPSTCESSSGHLYVQT